MSEDKVIAVNVEKGFVTLNLKDGTKIQADSITTYTKYASGRQDCNVSIEKPLSLSGENHKEI